MCLRTLPFVNGIARNETISSTMRTQASHLTATRPHASARMRSLRRLRRSRSRALSARRHSSTRARRRCILVGSPRSTLQSVPLLHLLGLVLAVLAVALLHCSLDLRLRLARVRPEPTLIGEVPAAAVGALLAVLSADHLCHVVMVPRGLLSRQWISGS